MIQIQTEIGSKTVTPNIVFSVTYYLELLFCIWNYSVAHCEPTKVELVV